MITRQRIATNESRTQSIVFLIRNDYKTLKFCQRKLKRCLGIFESLYPLPIKGELSLVFVDKKTICSLHQQFLNQSDETDIITFPGEENFFSAGEICISVDAALKNAEDFQQNFSTELLLYCAHGWLHLYGLDDQTELQCIPMRAAEHVLLEACELLKPVFSLS